jgi:diacylglycerol O-acyltransferase / wax synthase
VQLMEPLDALLLTAELLGNPMHVGVVLLLRPPADAGPGYADELYADAVTSGVEVDPRLLRRPHRGLQTGGLWAWQQVEELDVSNHVRRHTLESGTLEELWRLVGDFHEQALPRDRPMWEAVLVDGLADGRFAFCIKIHHAVVDGVTGLRMIGDSMSTDPDERAMDPFFGSRPRPGETSGPGGRSVPNPLRLAGAAVRTATGAAATGGRLLEAQAEALADVVSGEGTAPFGAPRTRLNGALTAARSFAAGSVERPRVRRVQEAVGEVTGNDVVTAMVAGALRSWLLDHDELPDDDLVAICPVSVRVTPDAADAAEATGAGEAGNAFGAALCRLGTSLDDPLARLELIHRSMATAKRRVSRLGPVPSLLTAAPSILPTILPPMLPLDPGLPPGYNLPISHVPGPRRDLYWNGAHLEEMYPASIVYDGMALNVTVCSYVDRLCFGFVAGADAVPDVAALVPRTEGALVELEHAAGLA